VIHRIVLPNSYVGVLPPASQNVTLFGNRAVADVSSQHDVILE
jgi:hypothetical protein